MNRIDTAKDYAAMRRLPGLKIVYFKSDWCADCAHADVFWPYMEKLYPDATCYRVDRDALADLARRLEIHGVPSYLVYDGKRETARYVDKQPKTFEQVKAFLDASIAKGSDR